MKFTQHPLSAAFPAMGADDFNALKDSIENIGVQNPITLFEGMVIDGWHRYTAAMELGIDCPVVELGDVDPRDFVLAQNKARRHITQAQLVACASAVYQWQAVGRPENSALSAELKVTSQDMAQKTGASVRTVEQFRQVERKASPEVVEAVKRGDIGLPKAVKIAQLPKEEQAAAISKPMLKAKHVEVEHGNHELAEAAQTIKELAEENDKLRDRLAVEQMDASEEAKSEASDTIADLRAQVKALEAELDAVKSSRDGFQRENAELKKQMLMQQKQLKKLGG